MELKPCPCGKTPTKLCITADHDKPKWASVSGSDCCGCWETEYRNGYLEIGSDESMERAVEAWNAAPRREEG